jgi:hypothetical protein
LASLEGLERTEVEDILEWICVGVHSDTEVW